MLYCLNYYNQVGCASRNLPQTSSSKQNWIHSSKYRFVHTLHPSNLSTEVECMSLWKAGCSTETGKTECTWETTNYMGFQPLVFGGVVRSLLMFSRFVVLLDSTCEDKYFREKLGFEICGSFFEKEDCAHVSRLEKGRFHLWICLETSNVCELRNMLKENGVCVLLELNMVESYTFTKRESKKKTWWSWLAVDLHQWWFFLPLPLRLSFKITHPRSLT